MKERERERLTGRKREIHRETDMIFLVIQKNERMREQSERERES